MSQNETISQNETTSEDTYRAILERHDLSNVRGRTRAARAMSAKLYRDGVTTHRAADLSGLSEYGIESFAKRTPHAANIIQLAHAMDAIRPEERPDVRYSTFEVIAALFDREKTYAQIAAELSIPMGSVKSAAYRCRQAGIPIPDRNQQR